MVIDDPGFLTSTLECCHLQPSLLLQKGSYISDPVNKSNLVVTEVFMSRVNLLSWSYLSGHEFEQTPGDSQGQGSLARCSPWGRKESDIT